MVITPCPTGFPAGVHKVATDSSGAVTELWVVVVYVVTTTTQSSVMMNDIEKARYVVSLIRSIVLTIFSLLLLASTIPARRDNVCLVLVVQLWTYAGLHATAMAIIMFCGRSSCECLGINISHLCSRVCCSSVLIQR
ncbi:hypothetical protein K503DRAFT_289026 [Rhizopogon vinicolor AM-OR11-026]|uniref:Uncharacterized protein n=1 Tax=Rhizopogon vinicolor AM-OR11-026 TaxID=1314800 RepID=A0A1B7MVE6_9AGAM|nr:hypothetical protein K503DRAFT_289026 [Rhizopogon vinicolor AM-OR11-026]